jgi:imidazole glycerol-phosphate synthase subunit HisH
VAITVTLLDYGMCNMLNAARALQHVGAEVDVTTDPEAVRRAERLVVPGVGAFSDSMAELTSHGHDQAIRDFVSTGRPLLGICVGMQILFEGSDEFGETPGLGILPGWVRAVPNRTTDGNPLRVPHIGWNALLLPRERNAGWGETLLAPHEGANPAMYFVHSFAPAPTDPRIRLADAEYGGHRICAAVARDNVTATQFHPERSATAGLAILEQFIGS